MRLALFARLGIGGLWLAALTAGLWILWHHETAPGRAAEAPSDWPAGSALPPPAGRLTVVFFAHPHCPCTRASLDELAWVLARAPLGGVRTRVVFGVPADAADDTWQLTPLWEQAMRLPFTRVERDPDGQEAQRFGAATSGQVVLYDGVGRRLWQGGLTAGRGVTGPSTGRAALLAALTDSPADRPDAPVYGCPVIAPPASCTESDPSCPN